MVERGRVRTLEQENAALRRALRLLHDLANLVRSADEPEAAAYAVLTGVTAGIGLGFHRAMIFVPSADVEGELVGMAGVGPTTREEADRIWRSIETDGPDLETLYEAGLRRLGTHGMLDQRVRATRVRVDESPLRSPIALALDGPVFAQGGDDLAGLLHVPTTIAAPMRGRDGVVGVLAADHAFGGEPPDPSLRQVFALVADHAGRALESARRFARVAREARTDALTGLDARRVGLEVLEHALSHANAGGPPVGLALIDLDDFKRVNDLHGHPVGDALLAAVGARLRSVAGRGERVFRYGGEELGMVLEGADGPAAHATATRVLEALRGVCVRAAGGTVAVTASIGVATSEARTGGAAQLIHAADEALLRAKRSGKDRVVEADAG